MDICAAALVMDVVNQCINHLTIQLKHYILL